jgi:NAD-dependent SIR2 family protein deacetylase
VASAAGRQRYWARATLGWSRFRAAEPNQGHRAAAALESAGALSGLITQNVDRLHQRAGHRRVVELHGALDEIVCLDCPARETRDHLQDRLLAANPGWLSRGVTLAPDGDAELAAEQVEDFVVLGCLVCGGTLKPGVVFFGEGVPRATVDAAFEVLSDADCLLVVGSSLTVFSGFRFVRRAVEQGKPVHVVNIGATRADSVAQARVAGPVGEVLTRLARGLGASSSLSGG